MRNKLREELDKLIAQVDKHSSRRRDLIKHYEKKLVSYVARDLIILLDENGFEIIEHKLNRWIHAKRGKEKICIWLPERRSSFGLFKLVVSYNEERMVLAIMVKHKYSHPEYNYLSLSYEKDLRSKIEQLKQQLQELETIKLTDIDGSYTTFWQTDSEEAEIKSIEECFKPLIKRKNNENS